MTRKGHGESLLVVGQAGSQGIRVFVSSVSPIKGGTPFPDEVVECYVVQKLRRFRPRRSNASSGFGRSGLRGKSCGRSSVLPSLEISSPVLLLRRPRVVPNVERTLRDLAFAGTRQQIGRA